MAKNEKMRFSHILQNLELVLEFKSKPTEIWHRAPPHIAKKTQVAFLKIFENFRFYANFTRKNANFLKISFFVFFKEACIFPAKCDGALSQISAFLDLNSKTSSKFCKI